MNKPEIVAAILWANYKLEQEGIWNQLKDVLAELNNDDVVAYAIGVQLHANAMKLKKREHDEWGAHTEWLDQQRINATGSLQDKALECERAETALNAAQSLAQSKIIEQGEVLQQANLFVFSKLSSDEIIAHKKMMERALESYKRTLFQELGK